MRLWGGVGRRVSCCRSGHVAELSPPMATVPQCVLRGGPPSGCRDGHAGPRHRLSVALDCTLIRAVTSGGPWTELLSMVLYVVVYGLCSYPWYYIYWFMDCALIHGITSRGLWTVLLSMDCALIHGITRSGLWTVLLYVVLHLGV